MRTSAGTASTLADHLAAIREMVLSRRPASPGDRGDAPQGSRGCAQVAVDAPGRSGAASPFVKLSPESAGDGAVQGGHGHGGGASRGGPFREYRRDGDVFRTEAGTRTDNVPSPTAPEAAGLFGDMADYLLRGYWNTCYGDGSRAHSLSAFGVDANNGVLHHNLSGSHRSRAASRLIAPS